MISQISTTRHRYSHVFLRFIRLRPHRRSRDSSVRRAPHPFLDCYLLLLFLGLFREHSSHTPAPLAVFPVSNANAAKFLVLLASSVHHHQSHIETTSCGGYRGDASPFGSFQLAWTVLLPPSLLCDMSFSCSSFMFIDGCCDVINTRLMMMSSTTM